MEFANGQPFHVFSSCLHVRALKYEPAGYAFHYATFKLLGCEEDDTAEVDDQSVSNDKEQVYSHHLIHIEAKEWFLMQ